MDEIFFTSSSPEIHEEELGSNIKGALKELKEHFIDQEIKALYWNDFFVAIPLILKISLPTRGTVNDVDVRKYEPIFILLNKQNYPYTAPLARSNRRDFPKECLPHLNPQLPGNPASFCLHRGNTNTWFSEHTLIEYVERIQGWLSDAASGRLIRKEDGFEATRIDESLGYYCIFESSKIQEKVINEWHNHRHQAGFCFTSYKLLKNPKTEPLTDKDSSYAIQLEYLLPDQNLSKILILSRKINSLFTENFPIDRDLYGILIWPPKKLIYSLFFADLPGNLKQFLELSDRLQLPLKRALTSYFSKDMQLFAGIPVTIVIPRPQHIIRTDSNLELLNFVIINDKWKKSLTDNEILEAKVSPMNQRSPLTLSRARDISSIPRNFDVGKILFLGCGAIGSKLALHIIKSGQCSRMTFADYDNLSPHNLVRHGLFNESLGTNKAMAMKAAIEKIFYTEKSKIEVNAIENDILDIFLGKKHEILCQHDWLIDATASASIRDVLVSENLPKSLSILRCEIADNGRLGFLSIEGNKRNPRLDDIQFYLYDIAIEKPEISNWLQSTKIQRETNPETNFEEIEIGISCNSETMRLGDDSVSFHASLFSLGFHKKSSETTNNNRGFLQISYNDVIRKSICNTQSYEVAPVLVIFDQNHKKWQIRISTDIQKQLTVLLHKSGRNETGGLLIGQIDPKKKIVYITRILPAPPDSKCWPIAFERGVLDVPEEVQKIRQQTGGMIDYVGEWHTHPGGGKKLSHIDIEAAKKIQKVLDPISRPTLVMIVTKDGLFPYVFSQEV